MPARPRGPGRAPAVRTGYCPNGSCRFEDAGAVLFAGRSKRASGVTEHADDRAERVDTSHAERFFRAERRAKLQETGAFLSKTKPTASQRVPVQRVSSVTKRALANIAKQAGLESSQSYSAFAVKGAPAPKHGAGKVGATPSRYFVTVGTPRDGQIDEVKRGVAVVAKEINGRIVGYRIYHQR